MSMLCFILAAKALVRMHICGGWSEHLLLDSCDKYQNSCDGFFI